MDDLRVGGEGRDLARDPIVEAGAEGDQEVGLLHRGDRRVVAVHPGHAEGQRVAVGEGAPGHEGGDDRCARQLDQLAQGLGGVGLQDAASGVDDGPASLCDELGRLPDHARVTLCRGLVAGLKVFDMQQREAAGMIPEVFDRVLAGKSGPEAIHFHLHQALVGRAQQFVISRYAIENLELEIVIVISELQAALAALFAEAVEKLRGAFPAVERFSPFRTR